MKNIKSTEIKSYRCFYIENRSIWLNQCTLCHSVKLNKAMSLCFYFGVFMAYRKKTSGETHKDEGHVSPDGTASIQGEVSAM